MKKFIFCFFLLFGCSSQKVVVNEEHIYCLPDGECFNIQRIFFVREHSYFEPGSTRDEVESRAYRVVGSREGVIENQLVYCASGSFCFPERVVLGVCDGKFKILEYLSSREFVNDKRDISKCAILSKKDI